MTQKTPEALDRLWEDIPTGQAPIGDLLTAGHAARRRNRRTALAGVTAMTALIVGSGFLASSALSDGNPGTVSHEPPVAIDNPDPGVPAGARLVGIGQVVVAVPSGWSSNDASCNTPVHDTYFFPYSQDCALTSRPEVASVAITSGSFTETGTFLGRLDPDGEAGGHEVQASNAVCETIPNGPCRQTFGIADLNAYFTVTIPHDNDQDTLAQIAAIRASLAVLPDDQTTVPFTPDSDEADVTRVLEAAGLSVTVKHSTCPPTADCAAQGVVDINPSVGTAVPAGTTVTVTVLSN